jgi:2-haloacid dehalogenase
MGSIRSIPIQHADLVELEMRSATSMPAGLKRLMDAGFRLVTLSNSPQGAQIIQLRHAGIDGYFERLLSV